MENIEELQSIEKPQKRGVLTKTDRRQIEIEGVLKRSHIISMGFSEFRVSVGVSVWMP